MKNLALIKLTLVNPEYRLYETLKLKKSLENRVLKRQLKLGYKNINFRIKCCLITRDLTFLYTSNILDLIGKIEILLTTHFSKFKIKGEYFKINSLSNLNAGNYPKFFKELVLFNKELEKCNASLIVHGSYADGTYISYSDVDLVIIGLLSEEVAIVKESIEKFLNWK